MNLYFVRASQGTGVCYAGHWLAESSKAAIEIAKMEMDTNPYSQFRSRECGWAARKSRADPKAVALNYPKDGHGTDRYRPGDEFTLNPGDNKP